MDRALALLIMLSACAAPPPPSHEAVVPAAHVGAEERTALLADRAHLADAPLVFLGDSITEGWEDAGALVWTERIVALGALNLGVSGDRTEHLLWRLQAGDYDRLPVQVAVVLIGTNNLGAGHTPAQTADGVRAVVEDVLLRWPGCRVLLLGLFPRGREPGDPLRPAVAATNGRLREVADRDRVTWLEFGGSFLRPDGVVSPGIMPDALHLSQRGYAIWADHLEEPLGRMLAP